MEEGGDEKTEEDNQEKQETGDANDDGEDNIMPPSEKMFGVKVSNLSLRGTGELIQQIYFALWSIIIY